MAQQITSIYSFLVRPNKGKDFSHCLGTKISLKGELFSMLSGLYSSTEDECKIDIRFVSKDGTQTNDARSLFVSHLSHATLSSAQQIAEKLEAVTTGTSGKGLLFIIAGNDGKKAGHNKLVVSRFPADEGIVANENSGALTVQLLKQVFLRNVHSYKAVMYKNLTSTSGVWKGKAVDRQITDFNNPTSKYWIKEFLNSDFSITPKHGTTRLAEAIRSAVNSIKDLALKEQIAAAAILLPQFDGKAVSVETALAALPLSDEARDEIRKQIPSKAARAETFYFDQSVYANIVAYKSIVLNTGVMVSANAAEFDDLVEATPDGKQTRFTTKGTVVNQKIRTSSARGAM